MFRSLGFLSVTVESDVALQALVDIDSYVVSANVMGVQTRCLGRVQTELIRSFNSSYLDYIPSYPYRATSATPPGDRAAP